MVKKNSPRQSRCKSKIQSPLVRRGGVNAVGPIFFFHSKMHVYGRPCVSVYEGMCV